MQCKRRGGTSNTVAVVNLRHARLPQHRYCRSNLAARLEHNTDRMVQRVADFEVSAVYSSNVKNAGHAASAGAKQPMRNEQSVTDWL